AGQASAGYGAIEDMVLGIVAVLSDGRVLTLRAAPRSAAGPDLRRLLVGSEGTLAVVTEVTLGVTRTASALRWEAFGPPTFEDGIALAREIVQQRLGPMVLRLYDEPDGAMTFGDIQHDGGPVLLVGFEQRPWLDPVLEALGEMTAAGGAAPLPADYGRHWWDHRTDAVALYQRIMGEERMLGSGVVVDTMEVAGLWRDVPELYRAVRDALAEHSDRAVTCHLSHPYRSGASLYFTFLLHEEDDRKAEEGYLACWRDAAAACHGAGGTISHHHGIGLLKKAFLVDELGPQGVGTLRAIKRVLDPAGVLNPGKLLPDAD
ncbi:MAG TPA: FAD-linked oxidase C-terminal domain-containing protein, partial [Actinomycetota bacterium]|nr:FAD-linked oxidase C-terminal domain-containing protein [Actinomycetota bacterium]